VAGGDEQAPGPHRLYGEAVTDCQPVEVPIARALACELLCVAADGDDAEAALLELVDAPVELAELGPADGAVVAAVEDNQRESLRLLSGEIPAAAADEVDDELGCLLTWLDAGAAGNGLRAGHVYRPFGLRSCGG